MLMSSSKLEGRSEEASEGAKGSPGSKVSTISSDKAEAGEPGLIRSEIFSKNSRKCLVVGVKEAPKEGHNNRLKAKT